MKITSVAAAKGGVAKTTLVAALATAADLDAPDRGLERNCPTRYTRPERC